MKKLILSFCCLSAVSFLHAQQTPAFELPFSSGTVRMEVSADPLKNMKADPAELVNGRFYRYIRFANLPSKESRTALEKSGIRLLHYIAANTYAASVSAGAAALGERKNDILGCYTIEPIYKMHKELSDAIAKSSIPAFAANSSGSIGITFTYYEDIPHQLVIDLLTAAKTEISYQNKNSHRVTVWIRGENIPAFVGQPFVCAAELKDDQPVHDNNVGRTNHRDNWLAQDHSGGRYYNGSGVDVMLQDDGLIGPHIDYTGRLIQQYVTFNAGNHGDHCAGIIMGGGNRDPLTRGMGWGANLYVYEASPYQGFDSIYSHYSSNNIVITSTSYSDGCNAGYTTLAQTLDQQIYDMPNLIHVFSAGNAGTSDCSYGAGAGWGNVTGGHKHSKNSIAVGNLDYIDAIASSSSRGPVHDGRMKPEVCAVGTNVYSTVDENTYEFKSGTSMSCPAVSGTFSEMYHAYKTGNGNINPPSGLMKAILMNTADDLGNPGPDFIFGYGRINGRKAVLPIEQNTFAVDSVQNSTVNTHTITVPAGTGRLKVLVYWHDYPAAVNASVALVNNLDIAVTDPSSAVFNPWVLDFTPNVSNLSANAVRGIDVRNNHEQVTIDNPAAGNYTVSVSGTSVPQGPQKYFLTWYFEPATEIVMIYPNGSEGFVPAETETIRWDAFGNSGTFSLDYSTDGGSSWNAITSGISATQRYYNWTVPVALSGMCKVRVTRGADNDASDANFSIIDVPSNITVQWACPDSLMLTWNAVGGATAYDIFMLGNTYMDSIGTTAADSFVVYNLNNLTNTYWFSVRAKGAQNAIGRRAIAIEKLPGAACPVQVDAAVSVVNSPGGSFNSCMSTSALQVSIGLDNPGLTAITNIPVYYNLNNGTPVSETYIGTIQPFGSATYTFTTTVNVSTPGVNTIKAWAVYPSDGNVMNDTSSAVINISTFPAVTPPWTEDFESFALCGTTSNCDSTICGMSNGLTNLTNNEQDDIDWRTSEGSTPSTQTGPGTDFLPGSVTGNYLYLEASGGCDGKTAMLYTPCIDLTNFPAATLSFAYHLYGASMGDLHVDVYSGGSWTNDIFTISGNQGNQWTQVQVALSAYAGQIITLRFRGVTGNGYASDMAIDAISVSDPSAVAEQNSGTAFSVYPNPGNGIYNLQISGLNKSAVTANVFDVTGRKIRSSGFGIVSGTLQTAIDLSAFENGLYYLELVTGETRTTIKLEKVE